MYHSDLWPKLSNSTIPQPHLNRQALIDLPLETDSESRGDERIPDQENDIFHKDGLCLQYLVIFPTALQHVPLDLGLPWWCRPWIGKQGPSFVSDRPKSDVALRRNLPIWSRALSILCFWSLRYPFSGLIVILWYWCGVWFTVRQKGREGRGKAEVVLPVLAPLKNWASCPVSRKGRISECCIRTGLRSQLSSLYSNVLGIVGRSQ